jgi:anthranilate synthase component 1
MKIVEIKTVNLLALHHHNKQNYPFLLESVSQNNNSNYSFLFCFPSEKIVLNQSSDFSVDFFAQLNQEIKIPKTNKNIDLPFVGGWFIYLAYELNALIEPSLKSNIIKHPIAIVNKIMSAIIIDHKNDKTYIIDAENNEERIVQIQKDISIAKELKTQIITGKLFEEEEQVFLNSVTKCKEHIIKGDTFQVNLARDWNFNLTKDISASYIYQTLCLKNPAPFSALIHFKDFDIISSSPERLFKVQNNTIETRPIAGTQAKNSKHNLLDNPKEVAEHIMLVDLERNDLGKICQFNTIKIEELLTVEKHPFVNHLVSNIKGILKEDIDFSDIIKALFPGGSITGCPKVKTMEIIEQLEKKPRGTYTGSIGYVSLNGNMDFNILIRSLTKHNNNLNFKTGSGIVFDSNPEQELLETRVKAKGLLKIFE